MVACAMSRNAPGHVSILLYRHPYLVVVIWLLSGNETSSTLRLTLDLSFSHFFGKVKGEISVCSRIFYFCQGGGVALVTASFFYRGVSYDHLAGGAEEQEASRFFCYEEI
jgi:hypothetical protein